MTKLLLSLLVAALAAVPFPGVHAFKAANREQCKHSLCFDSNYWVWCENHPKPCVPYTHGMYFEGGSGNEMTRMLFWESNQTLTWINPDVDEPVQLQWSFNQQLQWSKNITSGENHFDFTLLQLAEDAAKANNKTTEEVQLLASQEPNQFLILQPKGGSDLSGYFYPQDDVVKNFLDEQYSLGKSDMYNHWKLGVGIGVGIGVPILMALMLVLGFRHGQRRAVKPISKAEHHQDMESVEIASSTPPSH